MRILLHIIIYGGKKLIVCLKFLFSFGQEPAFNVHFHVACLSTNDASTLILLEFPYLRTWLIVRCRWNMRRSWAHLSSRQNGVAFCFPFFICSTEILTTLVSALLALCDVSVVAFPQLQFSQIRRLFFGRLKKCTYIPAMNTHESCVSFGLSKLLKAINIWNITWEQ